MNHQQHSNSMFHKWRKPSEKTFFTSFLFSAIRRTWRQCSIQGSITWTLHNWSESTVKDKKQEFDWNYFVVESWFRRWSISFGDLYSSTKSKEFPTSSFVARFGTRKEIQSNRNSSRTSKILLSLSHRIRFDRLASNSAQTNTKIEDTIQTKTTTKVRWFFQWFLSINFFFFSRTLTAVHDAILHDLVYPAEITGKRIRIKQDGSRLFKVHLDKNQQTLVENKVHSKSFLSLKFIWQF